MEKEKLQKLLPLIGVLKLVIVSMICMLVIIAGLIMNNMANPAAQAQAAPADGAAAAAPAAKQLSEAATKGQDLFKNNCSQCHAVNADVVVGPGLQGIDTRRDEAWIIKWVKNSQKVVASGDKYAVELYEKYNKTPMTAFDNFSDDDVKAIIAFVKESN